MSIVFDRYKKPSSEGGAEFIKLLERLRSLRIHLQYFTGRGKPKLGIAQYNPNNRTISIHQYIPDVKELTIIVGHELGHAIAWDTIKKDLVRLEQVAYILHKISNEYRLPLDNSIKEVILKCEDRAWKIAEKNVLPSIGFQDTNLLETLKRRALSSYKRVLSMETGPGQIRFIIPKEDQYSTNGSWLFRTI